MSNIVWDAVNGWHDGQRVAVSLERGRIVATPMPVSKSEISMEMFDCGYAELDCVQRKIVDRRADQLNGVPNA